MLYLGGYLIMDQVVPEALRALFADARRGGAKTVLDVVTPGPADYLPRLAPVLPEVDVFLPNDHEAQLITGEKTRTARPSSCIGWGPARSSSPRATAGRCWRGGSGCARAASPSRSSMAPAAATPSRPAT